MGGGSGRSQRGTQRDRGDCSKRKFPEHDVLLKTAGAGLRVDEMAAETLFQSRDRASMDKP
jgi:hypothetical protein